MYLILLGAPGAGKGTQAAFLSKEMKLAHIASGDLFRKNAQQGTRLGLLAKTYMDKGALVPNDITISMILERLKEPDTGEGIMLDGFPRNIEQAEALNKALAETGRDIDKVVYLKVPEEELLQRLGGRWICEKCQTPFHEVTARPRVPGKCDKCGGRLYQRDDDKPETIKKRLQEYFRQTQPLIDYYSKRDKLLEIDGGGRTPEGVWVLLKTALNPPLKKGEKMSF
ncbi:MAG: adenylate kinase [Chloroflexi bacterium]|nr:adenylate kinase [Chloroflexota bacterium]